MVGRFLKSKVFMRFMVFFSITIYAILMMAFLVFLVCYCFGFNCEDFFSLAFSVFLMLSFFFDSAFYQFLFLMVALVFRKLIYVAWFSSFFRILTDLFKNKRYWRNYFKNVLYFRVLNGVDSFWPRGGWVFLVNGLFFFIDCFFLFLIKFHRYLRYFFVLYKKIVYNKSFLGALFFFYIVFCLVLVLAGFIFFCGDVNCEYNCILNGELIGIDIDCLFLDLNKAYNPYVLKIYTSFCIWFVNKFFGYTIFFDDCVSARPFNLFFSEGLVPRVGSKFFEYMVNLHVSQFVNPAYMDYIVTQTGLLRNLFLTACYDFAFINYACWMVVFKPLALHQWGGYTLQSAFLKTFTDMCYDSGIASLLAWFKFTASTIKIVILSTRLTIDAITIGKSTLLALDQQTLAGRYFLHFILYPLLPETFWATVSTVVTLPPRLPVPVVPFIDEPNPFEVDDIIEAHRRNILLLGGERDEVVPLAVLLERRDDLMLNMRVAVNRMHSDAVLIGAPRNGAGALAEIDTSSSLAVDMHIFSMDNDDRLLRDWFINLPDDVVVEFWDDAGNRVAIENPPLPEFFPADLWDARNRRRIDGPGFADFPADLWDGALNRRRIGGADL